VDVKGRRGELDEEGNYGGAHLTWYTRLRVPQGDYASYGFSGLVRLDVHRSTLGIERVDALGPDTFHPYKSKVDTITQAVWREEWPAVERTGEVYPIQQLELVLKASLYPRRLLANLFTLSV